MKKFGGILLTLAMLFSLIPQAFAADYAYVVEEVYFTDLVGTVMENPGRSCMVNVKITKQSDRLGEDDMVIASYATDGTMIGFTVLGGTMDDGETNTYKTLVCTPEGKDIGVIKTYVWNNISEMKPLSLTHQTIVNEMDEGVYLPPIEDEEVSGENYVPSMITVRGVIADTPISNASLDNNVYIVSKLYIPDDSTIFDGIYEEDEYEALRARLEATAETYHLPLGANNAAYNVKLLSDIDLCDYLLYEMEFEIIMNSDGDYVVVTAQPYEVYGEVVSVAAEEYIPQSALADVNQYQLGNRNIRFDSGYYQLEDSVSVYVNGTLATTITNVIDVAGTGVANLTTAQADLDKYLGGALGTITLVDNGVNAGYETIMVDIWNIAKVLGVESEYGQTTVYITTKSYLPGAAGYETIVIDDEDVESELVKVTVQKDGETIDLASIAKGDIIAYKSEIGTSSLTELENPKRIEILATNATASGMFTSLDTDNETYTVGGTVYSAVIYGAVGTSMNSYNLSESYILTLDPFGRIYSAEKDGSAALYAIALSVTSDDCLKMVLADGTVATYPIESGATIAGFGTYTVDGIDEYLSSYDVTAAERVVNYKLRNSTGEISMINLAYASDDYWSTATEYNARTGRLGSAIITETTNVIDASYAAADYSLSVGYRKFDPTNFEEETKYKYVAFKTGTYTNLVVLNQIGTKISKNSRFAVVRKAPSTVETEDGDYVDSVIVLHGGEAEKELYFEPGVYASHGLDVGDAFYYEENVYGYVSDVFTVLDAGTKTFTTLATALGYKSGYISTNAADDYAWTFNLLNSTKHDIQLVEGYVVPGYDGAITFAEIANPLTRIDTTKDHAAAGDCGVAIFAVTEDTQAYMYNVSNPNIIKNYDKFSIKYDTSVLASTTLAKYEVDGVYDIANVSGATNMAADANYAIAMIVNDVVEEIYVIK